MPKPRTSRATTRQMKLGAKAEADRAEDHDDGDGDVDLLATEHVGQAPEGEGADEGAQDGGAGDPTGLEGAQVPLRSPPAPPTVPITKRS